MAAFVIVSHISDVCVFYVGFYISIYIAWLFDFYCFMALLFAWLVVCEGVFGNKAKAFYWRWLRRALFLLPICLTISLLFDALVLGPLHNDLFSYIGMRFYLTVLFLLLVTISSLVMIAAAVKVLQVLKSSDLNHSNSSLKRKTGITCVADAVLQIFFVVFVAFQDIALGDSQAIAILLVVLELTTIVTLCVNLYCVSFQLSDLVGSSEASPEKADRSSTLKARTHSITPKTSIQCDLEMEMGV